MQWGAGTQGELLGGGGVESLEGPHARGHASRRHALSAEADEQCCAGARAEARAAPQRAARAVAA